MKTLKLVISILKLFIGFSEFEAKIMITEMCDFMVWNP